MATIGLLTNRRTRNKLKAMLLQSRAACFAAGFCGIFPLREERGDGAPVGATVSVKSHLFSQMRNALRRAVAAFLSRRRAALSTGT
jgi:hypothetical protein